MKQIHKEYEQSFLLEVTKLTRLVDKMHERLGEHRNTTIQDSFEVFLSGNRHEEMTSIDEVLEIENSRKYKIQRLLIISSATAQGAKRPEHEIQVDFGKKKDPNKEMKVIEVSVRSEVTGWASRTLSELEEQIERTFLNYTIPVVVGLIGSLLCMLFLLFPHISFAPTPDDAVKTMWLRNADLTQVENILNQNRTITDEEMRKIATMQFRNVLEEQKSKKVSPKTKKSSSFLGWILPCCVLVIITTLFTCYPSSIFLWGDEVERYRKIVQIRNIIWIAVVLGVFVGVLANLISAKILPLLD